MASNLDFLVAFLMGILPGLLILWASLRRFDRPYVDHTLFDDRRVFGSLAVGLIFGTVASIFAIVLPRGDLASFAVAVAVSFVFEESFKLVWLNRRSYRGRFDTTFYGVPLGIGAAAGGVGVAGDPLRAGDVRAAHPLLNQPRPGERRHGGVDRLRSLPGRHVARVLAGGRRPPGARSVPLSLPSTSRRTVRRPFRRYVRGFCPPDLLLRLPGDPAGHAA